MTLTLPAHLPNLLGEALPQLLKRCRPCAACVRSRAGWGLPLLFAAMLFA